jgi:hypothetical protein
MLVVGKIYTFAEISRALLVQVTIPKSTAEVVVG